MGNVLDTMYADFSNKQNSLLEANKRAQKIYKSLLTQRNYVKSKVLFDLLSAEIIAYNEINDAFNKYLAVQAAYTTSYLDRIEGVLSSDTTADVDWHEKMYALNNILPINNSCDLYLNAVSRDSKDWVAIRQMLIDLSKDIIIGNTPVLSTIVDLVDTAMQIKNIVKEWNDDGTDYSDLDKELAVVEIHIQIMKKATEQFEHQARVLSDETGNHTSKTE